MIFWLNGMAGTGKSTISRTIAHSRRKYGDLGATFFFKRGEADRTNLKRFMTTLAHQLAQNVSGLAAQVKAAIDADSSIISKAVREQLHQLILKPLSNIAGEPLSPPLLVIILDALDECEQEDDARLLIQLLSRVKSPQHLRLRIFITSRPELPIRLGFGTAKGTYQDFILQEIPRPTIQHDITVFFRHELEQIREEFNRFEEEQQKLPPNWPGNRRLQKLVAMAGHLFIFAATMCRLIGDWRVGNPKKLLQEVLDQRSDGHVPRLHMTYFPALNQQLNSLEEYQEHERRQVVEEFRLVVGTIVMLTSPLSPLSLSRILDIPLDIVNGRLKLLHSVLMVPPSSDLPVRLLHLSFRDYLIDSQLKHVNRFWVNRTLTHHNLAEQCIRVMRNHLRQDICNLRDPGVNVSDVDSQVIRNRIPSELKYACLNWAHHRIESYNSRQDDAAEVYGFLIDHSLHWLEVMSLVGSSTESLAILGELRDWVQVCGRSSTSSNAIV